MTARGASADPTAAGSSDSTAVNVAGLRYGVRFTGNSDILTMSGSEFNGCGTAVKAAIANQPSGSGTNYRIINIPRTGAAATSSATGALARNDGNNGTNGQTGSGGSGQVGDGGTAGGGGAGTCFSGGAGGGGARSATSGAGSSTGGAGGNQAISCGSCWGGGGAGNPGGSGSYAAGGNGTGGLLWLVVGGNLTIGSTGIIESRGVAGGASLNCGAVPNEQVAGGGSGGGSIVVLYRGALNNSGNITALGGAGGNSCNSRGGNGGTGSIQILQIR